uniref:Uncharacterized protein n=1 Tax=Esox lucius TaxID=8010 RepID=A0A6Q2Z9I0_ESOLU
THHHGHILIICQGSSTGALTGIKCGLQGLDVCCHTRDSVDSHLLHASALNLLHTLLYDEGNLGPLPSVKGTRTAHLMQETRDIY